MNTPISEATYMQGRPKPVVFRKVDRPDVTITIIGDFDSREIADLRAPKEGKIGEAYVAENLVFLWDVGRGVWVAEGQVGDIWEPVPYRPFDTFNAPTLSEEEMLKHNPNASKEASNLMGGYIYVWNSTGGVYENIGRASELLGNGYVPELLGTLSFTMKGNWKDGEPLPEKGAEPGDCYIWEGHCWARTSLHEWKDYGDLSHMASVQFEFLNDCNNHPAPKPVVFRKIVNHDATVNVLYDFVNLEIAEAHAPKEGKPGDAYVADNIVFVWGGYHDDWVAQGKVGEVWEPMPPPTAGLAALFNLPRSPLFGQSEQNILQGHYHDDVRAGYGGTFEQWRNQNGDLNAVLCKAAGKDLQDPIHLESVRSLEEQRLRMHKRELLADVKDHPSLDDVESLLQGALTKLESQESDAAFKALDALKKVKVDLRRKRRNTWLRWMLFWAILGGVVYGLYKWIPTQVVSGHYTVTKTCSVPFGNGTITGMRYYNYGYKSLFGVHMTLESTVRENTDVTRNGQEFTIFGLSPRNEAATEEEMALADKVLKTAEVEVETAPKPPKGKWWRINIWTSDKGTHWMKPAELYLFASEKFTTMVAYKDFCK